jgi:acetolactate synthase-1/2/3 large subunit
VLRNAFKQMTTGRPGAVHIGLPYDVQKQMVDAAELWGDASLNQFPARRTCAEAAAIADAAGLLAKAERPLFIVGGGVVISGAEPELIACAELLGAAVATTISGQGSIGDGHALALGVVGSNGGTLPTRAVVQAADLIVFVSCRAGSVTTERWRYPAPGKATVIQLDIDPGVIGTNYPVAVGLVGDAKLTLAALRDALEAAGCRPRAWGSAAVAAAKQDKFAAFRTLAESKERPIRPERWWRSSIACSPATPSWSPIRARPARISPRTTRTNAPGGSSSATAHMARWAIPWPPRPAPISGGRARKSLRSWVTAASVSPWANWRPFAA